MSGAVPPLFQYAFMAWCTAKVQEQLYLIFYYFTLRYEINTTQLVLPSTCPCYRLSSSHHFLSTY